MFRHILTFLFESGVCISGAKKNFCRRLTETKALTDRDVTTGTKYMGSINNVIRDRAAKVVFGINGSLDSSG